MKEFLLHWLGIDALLAEQQAAFDAALATQQEEFNRALASIRADLESRSGVVLEASIDAADKISRIVSSQGDSNLKEYIDSCFTTVFQEPILNELTN